MSLLRDVAHEMKKMFVSDARLTLAILVLVLLAAAPIRGT